MINNSSKHRCIIPRRAVKPSLITLLSFLFKPTYYSLNEYTKFYLSYFLTKHNIYYVLQHVILSKNPYSWWYCNFQIASVGDICFMYHPGHFWASQISIYYLYLNSLYVVIHNDILRGKTCSVTAKPKQKLSELNFVGSAIWSQSCYRNWIAADTSFIWPKIAFWKSLCSTSVAVMGLSREIGCC